MENLHPLEQLKISECNQARDVVRGMHREAVISFRTISLEEPPKAQLQKFLEIEHSGNLQPDTSRPGRLARVSYDVIGINKIPVFHESVVDVCNGIEVAHEIIDAKHHAPLTMYAAHFSFTQRVNANVNKGRVRPPSQSRLGLPTLQRSHRRIQSPTWRRSDC